MKDPFEAWPTVFSDRTALLAAKAVALGVPDKADALEVLDCLGLTDRVRRLRRDGEEGAA